jgi:hypothetical protein
MTRIVCLQIAKVIRAFVCSFLHAEIPSLDTFIGKSLSKISEDLFSAANQGIEEITTAIDHSNTDENFQMGLLCFAKRVAHEITDTDPLPLSFYERVRVTIVRVCAARNPERTRTALRTSQQHNVVTKEVLQDVVLWVRKELGVFGTPTIEGRTQITKGCVDVTTVNITPVQEGHVQHERTVRPRHR